jgi:hypothetical protein
MDRREWRMRDEAYSSFSEIDETPVVSGTALTVLRPVAEPVRPIRMMPRPDASFVTQLIATAENSPQTRTLRRASSADALAAYHSTADRGRDHAAVRARCSI